MNNDPLVFSEAAAAHAQVKATVASLREEYDATEAEIERTAAELDRQLNLRLPPDEMKRAVIEVLAANAKRFEQTMHEAICDFVKHKHGDATIPPDARNKPMTYGDVESIISGKFGCYNFTNLLKAGNTPYVFDAPMTLLFGEVIYARLQAIMADVGSAEMGYGSLHDGDIGCGLHERRTLIAKLKADLTALKAHRTDLAGKLAALGNPIPYKPNRQA